MKKVVKKVVAKAPVKRTVAKKPMMKSGGAKRTLRKYQGDGPEGSEVGPGGGSARPSFADAYKANISVGIRPAKARKIAMVESGVKEQKKRIDPNTVINAIGNTAGAVGSVANAFRKPAAGSTTTSGPAVNPGSTSIGNQNSEMEFEKRGGAIKKKGGAMKKLGCAQCGKSMKKGGVKKYAAGGSTLSGSAIKKAPVQLYGIPQQNLGTSGQYGQMKKGGSTSVINRAVKPGCRGGMVKDANGNCVEVRKAKKGGTMKDLSGDGKITRKDVLIGRGVIAKKAQGGPIIDKLKAKLAERKVTKTIKKSVKSSGKRIK